MSLPRPCIFQDLSWIKLIDGGREIACNNIRGFLPTRIMTFLVNLHMQRRRAPRPHAPLANDLAEARRLRGDVTMRALLAAHPSSALRAALFTSRAMASPSTTSTGRSLKPAAPHLLDCRIQARQGLHLTAPPARSPPTFAHPCCPATRSAESPCGMLDPPCCTRRGASGARLAPCT